MFSSKQYAWSDINVAIKGRIINGITEIEYTKKRGKEGLYGRGADPHDITRGNNEYEGKITLWQSEIEAMIASSPKKDILSLRFDVVVSYVPEDGGIMVTDILKSVEFLDLKKGMKQGDKNMLVELPIIFLKVLPQQ